MKRLTAKEIEFVRKNSLSRLGTASKDAYPHVTPVVHAYANGLFYIAIDYETKKLKNLRENNKVALVVDTRTSRGGGGIMIQGEAEILERGNDYGDALKILFDRFAFYRKNPWKEGESPIIKITPEVKVSWGINSARE